MVIDLNISKFLPLYVVVAACLTRIKLSFLGCYR